MGDNNDFNSNELLDKSSSEQNDAEMSKQPMVYTTSSGQKIIRAKKSNLLDIQKEKAEKKSFVPVIAGTVIIIIIAIIILLLFCGIQEKTENNNGGVSISAPENEIPTLVTVSENGELSVSSIETDTVWVKGNTYTINGRTYSVQKDIDGKITGILNSEGADISIKDENGVIDGISDEDGNIYKVTITENNTQYDENGDNKGSGSIINIDYTKKPDDNNENSGESNSSGINSSISVEAPSINKPVTDTTSISIPELTDEPTVEKPTIGNITIETPGIVGKPSIVTPQIEISTVYIPTK